MISEEITIINKLGLHARAAAKLVSVTSRFRSRIFVGRPGTRLVDAKSIMALLMLAASKGSPLQVNVEGDDAEEAMTAVRTLIANRFDEEE